MAKIKSIARMYNQLEDEFKEELIRRTPSICLLELLSLPSSEIPQVTGELMKYYDKNGIFEIGGHRLGITLEDVLCLTGLPITGEPLICENTRDATAFSRVFGLPDDKRYTLKRIKSIAIDREKDREERMKAIILLLIHSFILPTSDGYASTTYVQFAEEMDKVNNYAWGAALLAFLIQALDGDKKTEDGNMWVLLSFFLVRIPKLRNAVQIEWREENFEMPLLKHIAGNIRINHSPKHIIAMQEDVRQVLSTVVDDDIIWMPYTAYQASPYIENNAYFGTLIVPIFCNNHFVFHEPHRVARQFGVLADKCVEGFKFKFPRTKKAQNRGPHPPNYKKKYENLIYIWNNPNLVQDLLPPAPASTSTSTTATTSASTSAPAVGGNQIRIRGTSDGRARRKIPINMIICMSVIICMPVFIWYIFYCFLF